MQYLIVVAFVAAYAGLSEAVTCENVGNCTPDISKLQGGGSQDDIKEACASIKSAMQCFRDAMADCRTNSNIPEDTLTKLESQMDSYDQMLSGYCGSDGSNQQGGGGSNGAGLVQFSVATLFTALLALLL